MTTWFTSDLHLFHRSVAYERRYGSWPINRDDVTPEDVEWHNDLLAAQWDAHVRSDDTVWVLGDMTASDKNIPAAMQWMRERKGSKYFITGNHDPCHPMHRNSIHWQSSYQSVPGHPELGGAFRCVYPFIKRSTSIEGRKIYLKLSHFPYSGDNDNRESKEDRFDEWRLKETANAFLLHGHTHSKNKFNGLQIHVGVDAWDYTPVPLEVIQGYISDKLHLLES